ncbi:MAG: bifunctional glutamate N-acetyltransferase/amino-acid acetyltransferase ArgJ [Chloroflexi bacterium]|nr:bifunctional glutamate N-acetyltransferase/amino-acid acetyltransferase ArgJ [Chloroflexota bacterium]MCL5074837.1 bifunctional glutamate N-acetyltransferase/amino-acid acetyltransferase ArgJ [Chloroflexota bacterium]
MHTIELIPDGGVTSVKGFLAGATRCGLKTQGLDLAIIYAEVPCAAAGVFTTNRVKAAPIHLSQAHLRRGTARAVVVNSGNANACTGEQGYAAAQEMAQLTAERVGVLPQEVLVASTGVIGVPLALDKMRAGLRQITLSAAGGHEAALAILTTDSTPKEIAVRVDADGTSFTIGGMAKGSGMIHPSLATMLSFITTDAALGLGFPQIALRQAVDVSFNMITVDRETSTNDTVFLLANSQAGHPPIGEGSPLAHAFQDGLRYVVTHLAKMIARDGEGATRLIEVIVEGAANVEEARLAARAVAGSNLVKAAVYGRDPNWGRILAAVGYSGAMVDDQLADITIGDVVLMSAGQPQPYDRSLAREALSQSEVTIRVDLHLGSSRATAWGCDLTEEYVIVNSKYTT